MSSSSRRSARNQALPTSEAAKLRDLSGFSLYRQAFALYQAGWTLRAIGEAFDPVKSRSTVQSWVNKGREVPQGGISSHSDHVEAPQLVTEAVYTPKRPVSPGIPPGELTRIQELAPVSRRFRSGMSPLHKASQANQELTTLVMSLYDGGVSIRELSDAAGVTYRAMAKRLGRA